MISVIVPAHNEEESIDFFLPAITPVMEKITKDYEIIFINDGSNDKTANKLRELEKKNSYVRFLDFTRNFGKDAAISAGLDHCKGNLAVIIDADLEHPPETILEFYEKLQDPNVYQATGIRSGTSQSFLKKILRKVFHSSMKKYSSINFPPNATDFCMIRREVIDTINSMKEKERFIRGLLSWHGYKTEYVDFEVGKRSAGTSSFSASAITNYARKGFISFSTTPLKIWIGLGGLIALISFAYISYVILKHLFIGTDVPGFVTVVCMIGFFGGINLIVLGVIGEYIAELFKEAKGRPLYIIKK